MGRLAVAISRRLGILLTQVIGVVTVVFVLVRLLPGDPAYLIAGPQATTQAVKAIRARMGLDQSLPVQYFDYMRNVFHGDLGQAFSTGNSVVKDLRLRVPATLELITAALLVICIIALILTFLLARRPDGIVARAVGAYAFVAGALPDFWIGLALIFVIYFKLGLVSAPAGQIDPLSAPPTRTGAALIDALLAGDFSAVSTALGHMILPVATLVLVYLGPVLRLTAVRTRTALDQDFIRAANALGIKRWRVITYAMREALPTFITMLGTTYGYLLGGAVLVETVFSWGGAGQYAVQAVAESDYAALQGFVIVAGLFTAIVYAVVDLLYLVANPRARG